MLSVTTPGRASDMMLVCMDLLSSYLAFEEVAEIASYDTWQALVEARLKAWGTGVLSLVSDRATAFMMPRTGDCLDLVSPDLHALYAPPPLLGSSLLPNAPMSGTRLQTIRELRWELGASLAHENVFKAMTILQSHFLGDMLTPSKMIDAT